MITDKDEVCKFQKYKLKGAYHWEQIGINLFKRNIFTYARYKNMIHILEMHAGNIKGKKILDVGCGDGVLSYLLSQKGAIVTGLDSSEIAINFAKNKTHNLQNITFIEGNAYNLPFDNDSFDLVISSEVIEHLCDVNTYLNEIKRVSKYDSYIVISSPIRCKEEISDPEHIVEWFPSEFKDVMENKFSNSEYFYSHPLAIREFYEIKYLKFILNLVSLVYNPIVGFNSRFRHMFLQYTLYHKIKKTNLILQE